MPITSHSPPAGALLPRGALDELLNEIAIFPVRSQQRGISYAASGRVISISVDHPFISAQVRGTRVYRVSWEKTRDGWMPECECPVGVDCKHSYAAACWILAEARSLMGYSHPRLMRLVPLALDAQITASGARGELAPTRPSTLRRSGGAASHGPLRKNADYWERQESLDRMMRANPKFELNLFAAPFPGILREPDPDLMCWFLAQEIPRHTEGWLPPELESYRERPDLAERHAERLRSQLADELTAWASRRRPRAERSLRAVLGLNALADGRITFAFEARVTGPRLQDEPRSLFQLLQLRSAMRRSPGLLASEQSALLEFLTDGESMFDSSENGTDIGAAGFVRLIERFSAGSCLMWDAELPPDLAARTGVSAGSPVVLDHAAARLLPTCVVGDDGARIALGFVWPDGRQRHLAEVVHLPARREAPGQHAGLVLSDGVFSIVSEEPPRELIDLFAAAGGLPVRREQAETVLAPLAASFPSIQTALTSHTRLLAVRPAFALDLRADDWLQIRLFARLEEPGWSPGDPVPKDAYVYEYTPDSRWVRAAPDPVRGSESKKTAPPAGMAYAEFEEPAEEAETSVVNVSAPSSVEENAILFEVPDPARVGPTVRWLETLEVTAGTVRGSGPKSLRAADANRGWWLRLRTRSARVLADAWDERPDGCDWFGTERVRRLLVGVDRLRPRLRVQSSGVDWFSVSADWESEGLQLSDADLAKLRVSSARLVKLAQGWVRREAAVVLESAAEVLADLGIEAGAGEQRVTLWQLAQAKTGTLEAIQQMGGGSDAAAALGRLREQLATFDGLPRVAPPAGFHGELRPYQQVGLDFLMYTSSLGLGAILADDMGLGKTVQALAWIETLREREPQAGPTLVLCPASVMHNWQREAERFVPGMRVLMLERGQRRHSLRAAVPDHDLIVTNYSLFRRDLEDWKTVPLRAVIVDEAQNIKNPDAEISRAVLELRPRCRLALTGTPLENRALDLWSILAFVNPGYLGSRRSFSHRFDRTDVPPHARPLLAAKLRPVMLRRMKQEVAKDLPARIEERRDCEMTRGQRMLYSAELARIRADIAKMSKSDQEVKKNRFAILVALTRLRQLCCHPALVGGKHALGSGKFEAGFELLEPLLAEGHKVLLFSQFVECLKLLGAEMKERGIAHHVLTGKTIHREQVVADFSNDPRPCVFLVSLKAGGTGLNLTAASYVILFDPWWNPAVEAQAIDRTHRIGQHRTVIAYRLLTQGSVEEKIWELQQRKSALAKEILGEDGFARTLTRDDLDYLLGEE